MTIEIGTQRKVRVVKVTTQGIEVADLHQAGRARKLETQGHLYLPVVGNYCIMEKTATGWRILRRTLAP